MPIFKLTFHEGSDTVREFKYFAGFRNTRDSPVKPQTDPESLPFVAHTMSVRFLPQLELFLVKQIGWNRFLKLVPQFVRNLFCMGYDIFKMLTFKWIILRKSKSQSVDKLLRNFRA